jgi:uncharacterized protein YndB with AHSA1/START domain
MIDIIHRVGIKARPSKVYAALSTIEGVAGWWTKETSGVSKPGGTIDFQFSSPGGERIGGMTMEVLGWIPTRKCIGAAKRGLRNGSEPTWCSS